MTTATLAASAAATETFDKVTTTVNERQSSVSVDIDLSIYSQEAVNTVLYTYSGRFFVEQQKLTQEQSASQSQPTLRVILLCKEVKDQLSTDQANTLKYQLLQDILDQQVRLDLEKRFGHIRDLLVAEAFKPIHQ